MEKNHTNDLKEDRQGYYCVIPWKILTDKNISSTTKLLYGEISALINKEGFCWANNQHFADILNIKNTTQISKLIGDLKRLGYIYIEIDRKNGNKRKIWIYTPIMKKHNRYYEKTEEGIMKKHKKDNHIDKQIDNTIINKQVVEVKSSVMGKEFNELIALFKPVNPSYERLFPNKGQRAALERLLKKYGHKKIKWILDKLPAMAKMSYAPVVTTPYQLEQKLGQLVIFLNREKNKKGGVTDARNID